MPEYPEPGRAFALASGDEVRIVLRADSAPPAKAEPFTEKQRQTEAELVRQLEERFGPPKPVQDPWVDVRKDLDAYLAEVAKQPIRDNTQLLLLARQLADDKPKALRVVRLALEEARRLPERQISAGLRIDALLAVADTARTLGFREEAVASLTDAEKLMEKRERGLIGAFPSVLAGWLAVDPAEANRLLKANPGYEKLEDVKIQVAERLVSADPVQAAEWFARLLLPQEMAPRRLRPRLTRALAGHDLAKAIERLPGPR